MRRRINTNVAFYMVIISVLTGCNNTVLYENNQGFENNTWAYEDSKTFSFDILDSLQPVKLSINFRTTTDYPFANIYLFVHSDYPNGYNNIDTIEFFLADAQGNWLGDNSGTIVENRALLSKGVFPTTGKYSFKLEQAMRNDSLPEIIDIGLSVQKIVD